MVLQSIRDRLHGIIAIFIFAILIIPFAFVGVNSYFTSGTVNAVAVVNDQEITLNDYNAAFQNYRRRLQAQMGQAFDPELFDQAIIRRQFLDQMINEELMAQVSIDAGLAVTDEKLAESIRSLSAFEVDGEFNVDVYQQRLAAQGLTPQQFEMDLRGSLVMDQFPNAIGSSAIATRWELEDYARLQDQTRAFSAVVVPAVVDTESVIGEEELLAWYEDHQADYMSKEQVVIEYLELDAELIGGDVEVDEESLKARFEEQQGRFISPEARLASHILIEVAPEAPQVDIETARKTAEELSQRARDGEDFVQLATGNSQDLGSATDGGDLGWIEPGYMVQAFEDALYELSLENPVSEPVQTRFGWHVIQLRDIRPSEGMTFTEARDILLAEYQAETDERRFIEQADRLIDIIYEDPTTLSAAAEELGLEVQEAGPFGRGGAESGIAANREVVDAAFSDLVLGQHSVSDPVDLDTNHIVLILLKEHLPVEVIPFAEVREQVLGSVQEQRAMEVAAQTAEAMLARLEGGEALEDLAAENALEVIVNEAATRTMTAIDSSLRSELFLMEKPEEGNATTAVVEVGEGYAVVRLDRVTDGVLAEGDVARIQAYSRRIASASATDEALGFIEMLRAQSTIEVFEDRLR
ncbi:MAG: SurA N-terminal domain-containing protein [Xanthomonadales bacterium]|jgi:peptidyl-prolyl cis-trans isomerase D|nr:SurA N-terminal domain-containing protein [Xanthomonadales bacterium]